MLRIRTVTLITLILFISGCGDTPSSIGQKVQDRLTLQKESFESETTKSKFSSFISEQSNWSNDTKISAKEAFAFVQEISLAVNPKLAKNGIESGEMAIACAITLMKDQSEVEVFTENLLKSVDSNESRIEVIKQISDAKIKIADAAIKKENCL